MAFKPSPFQQDIFDFMEDGQGSALVEAVAGSGKTTTMVQALEFTKGSVLFCAFNKAISNELRKKAPRHVDVGTLHSMGLKLIRKNITGQFEVYDKKTPDLIKDVVRDHTGEQWVDRALLQRIRRLVGLCKGCMYTEPDINAASLEKLTDRYGVDINGTDIEDLVFYVGRVLQLSLEMTGAIDFDDMIWMPAVHLHAGRWIGLKYNWVMVDEAQDLNRAQQELVSNLLARDGRMIAVGDSKQAIYGFRGADAQSMPNLMERFDAKPMPLSICYRCPRTHIKLAQVLVPQIEAPENALEGVVDQVTREDLVTKAKPGDLIMCRRNAPLVKLAFELIRQGVKAVVRGRDIGQGLVGLVDRSKKSNLADLILWLDDYRGREVAKLRMAEREQQAQSVEDKVECIMALCEGIDSIVELKAKIEKIFSDKVFGVILSSIHRAKGLEANRTFILEYDRMPMQWKNQKPWQLEQEKNLQYVALTRSKHELYFIDSPPPGALFSGSGTKGQGLLEVDLVAPNAVTPEVIKALESKEDLAQLITGPEVKARVRGKFGDQKVKMVTDPETGEVRAELESDWKVVPGSVTVQTTSKIKAIADDFHSAPKGEYAEMEVDRTLHELLDKEVRALDEDIDIGDDDL